MSRKCKEEIKTIAVVGAAIVAIGVVIAIVNLIHKKRCPFDDSLDELDFFEDEDTIPEDQWGLE